MTTGVGFRFREMVRVGKNLDNCSERVYESYVAFIVRLNSCIKRAVLKSKPAGQHLRIRRESYELAGLDTAVGLSHKVTVRCYLFI